MRTLLALLLCVSPAAATFRVTPVAPVTPAVGVAPMGVAGAGLSSPRLGGILPSGLAAPSLSPTLTPSLALPTPSAPMAVAPVAAAAAVAPTAMPSVAAGRSAVGASVAEAVAAPADPKTLVGALSERAAGIAKAAAPGAAPQAVFGALQAMFSGPSAAVNGVSDPRRGRGSDRGGRSKGTPRGFLKNADGVWVGGRSAEYALWINAMHGELSRGIDLDDVMNVMDDAYDEGRVKLASVEKAAQTRQLDESSVHIEGTRNWVDGILTDSDGSRIAVHTHRVYFHPAPGNPASEISEGIRRVGKYLDKAKEDFGPRGGAERELKTKFAHVELNFDTRGYAEIADYIRGREAEFRKAYGDRFVFNTITEPRLPSAQLRAEYNRLVEKYWSQPEGVAAVIDGVTYSRQVGVGHELNSHKKRIKMGLKITQAGRDFFGDKTLPDGRVVQEYKTEFDAVTEPQADAKKPLSQRDVVLWEDKSVRVWMPLDKVMEETFLYKLRVYRDNRDLIEKSLGGAPLKVAFSVDVGGSDRRAAKMGLLVWQDLRQKELMEHLKASEARLSAEYGFPVSFIFVNSHPGEDPDLFNRRETSPDDWGAILQGARSRWNDLRQSRRR
ncbi:MAG: hypothetical protein HYZ75_02870 [Elusimicrobia bacterium]|nr:hypothetical protein [Elusimicrobiota bacterium]